MKFKKVTALALAASMVMAPTTAFAAEVVAPTSETASINGVVNYVDTVVYKVTLPTTDGLKFTLDPQGLLSLGSDGTGSYSDANAGEIAATGGMFAINKSSVPIKLSAQFYVTDANKKASTVAKLVDSAASVTDRGNDILLQVIPYDELNASADLASVTSDTVGSLTNWSTTEADFTSITGTTTAAPTKLDFLLGAAEYEFKTSDGSTFTYEPKAGATTTQDAVAFKLGGKVSKDGDWSAFTGSSASTLQLNCVFSFKGLKDITGATSGTSHGLVDDASKIKYLDDLALTLTKGADADITAPVTVPGLSAATVTKIVATGPDPDSTPKTLVAKTQYTSAAKVLTLTPAYLKSIAGTAGVAGEYVLELTLVAAAGKTAETQRLTITVN